MRSGILKILYQITQVFLSKGAGAMNQTHALNDSETMTHCLPGADRFLAISAAYLSAGPAAVSGNASNGQVPFANRSVPTVDTETAGARL